MKSLLAITTILVTTTLTPAFAQNVNIVDFRVNGVLHTQDTQNSVSIRQTAQPISSTANQFFGQVSGKSSSYNITQTGAENFSSIQHWGSSHRNIKIDNSQITLSSIGNRNRNNLTSLGGWLANNISNSTAHASITGDNNGSAIKLYDGVENGIVVGYNNSQHIIKGNNNSSVQSSLVGARNRSHLVVSGNNNSLVNGDIQGNNSQVSTNITGDRNLSSGIITGNNNIIYIAQVGNDNSSTIDRTGNNGRDSVTTTGRFNWSTINSESDGSYNTVRQRGSASDYSLRNTVQITQQKSAGANTVLVEQGLATGNDATTYATNATVNMGIDATTNYAEIKQTGASSNATLTQTTNAKFNNGRIQQSGALNTATLEQQGERNRGFIYQSGKSTASIQQLGSAGRNFAQILQFREYTRADITQQGGSFNIAGITQFSGGTNALTTDRASITQTGNSNQASISQWYTLSGNNVLAGNNRATISQSGNNNAATIYQSGANNTASISVNGSNWSGANAMSISQTGNGLSATITRNGNPTAANTGGIKITQSN